MPDTLSNQIIVIVFAIISILALVGIVLKVVRNLLAPVKTVKAEVIDKHINESFRKYAGNGKQEKYVVTFSVNGKKKGFYVSSFSYNGYRIGEKGTLKYKGDQLIGFQ